MDFQVVFDAQPQIVRHLKRSKDQSKLSHAYIFEGSKDSFVEEMATYFAVLLMCENPLECDDAKRVIHRTHPNIKYIESSTQTITKDDILELQHDFNQTALEEGPKVYLILDAHKMNSFAANALLKFLEEPHPDIYGVLVTDDASKLLPTLISRSQVIPFPSIGKKIIEKQLIDAGFEPFKSKIAAQLFQRLERAQAFIEDEEADRMISLTKGLYQAIHKGRSLRVFMHQEFPDLAKDKASMELFLELTMLYLKDLLYAKMGVEEAFIFSEEINTIQGLDHHFSKKQLLNIWEKILDLKEKLHQPIHHSLAFEDFMTHLERGPYEA
jgi:DNA polymerase-3 subunit delta'